MIDIGKILKRSWAVLWSYRVLWIFGILLALTAGSSFNGGNSGYQFSSDERDWQNIPTNGQMQEFNRWMDQNVEPYFRNPEQHIQTFIWPGLRSGGSGAIDIQAPPTSHDLMINFWNIEDLMRRK